MALARKTLTLLAALHGTSFVKAARLLFLVVAAWAGAQGSGVHADEATIERKIGDASYRLKLVFEDDFANLDNWLVETTGKVAVKDNWLSWDCFSSGKQAGTIWCRKQFAGPTVIEFDAVGAAGARNLNFILYATHPKGLLETTRSRTGEYGEYHEFPNYIVTYLTPPVKGEPNTFADSQWRIRFRKNPGFKLLSESLAETKKEPGRKQRVTYVLDGYGRMKLFVDGELLHAFEDTSPLYRSGHHGFRTWNSDVKYANFKVYSIQGQ
jgi:hypothetical protein